ncbi:MAG: ABC transporter ATP-binding protein [Pseudomonadota bacterium]
MSALLEVQGLEVGFPAPRGERRLALRGVDLTLNPGERLGIVGESGAGKSMLGFALLNLLPPPGRVTGGSIRFDGQNLLKLRGKAMREIRGKRISMIFQDPMATLNPVMTVGAQMVETLAAHERISARRARDRSVEMLAAVQVPNPEKRFDAYPHELSGGLRQRVVIAISLLTEPEIVIADEPTTALDVTIQAEIMALLLRLCRERQVGLILITHDLGVVAEVTERLMILYAGRAVETGPTRTIIDHPRHPYAAGLLAALPARANPGEALHQIPGSMPGIGALPDGCAFRPRCEHAYARCYLETPELGPDELDASRCHACYLPLKGGK